MNVTLHPHEVLARVMCGELLGPGAWDSVSAMTRSTYTQRAERILADAHKVGWAFVSRDDVAQGSFFP